MGPIPVAVLLFASRDPFWPICNWRLCTADTVLRARYPRGWATDEPLQPAGPVRLSLHPGAGEEGTEEATSFTGEVESIQSFNNTLSASLPRRPGAWDTPAGNMRKSALSHAPAPAGAGAGVAAGARDARSQVRYRYSGRG